MPDEFFNDYLELIDRNSQEHKQKNDNEPAVIQTADTADAIHWNGSVKPTDVIINGGIMEALLHMLSEVQLDGPALILRINLLYNFCVLLF